MGYMTVNNTTVKIIDATTIAIGNDTYNVPEVTIEILSIITDAYNKKLNA